MPPRIPTIEEQHQTYNEIAQRGYPLKLKDNPVQQRMTLATKKKRIVIALTGQGVGKTLWAIQRAIEYGMENPKSFIWVVTPDYNLGEQIWDYATDNEWVDTAIYAETKRSKPRRLKLIDPWSSVIEFKSADDPDSLVARRINLAVLDEIGKCDVATGYRAWMNIAGRVRKGKAVRMWVSTTPYDTSSWMNEVLSDTSAWARDVTVVKGNAQEAGTVDKDVWESWKDQFKDSYYAQRVLGDFKTSFGGVIYPDFDWNAVKAPREEVPPEFPIYVGMDFGFTNPAAIVIGTRDLQTGIYKQLDEFEEPGLTSADLAEQLHKMILNLPRKGIPKITRLFPDPTSSQKDKRHPQNIVEMLKHLMKLRPQILSEHGKGQMIAVGPVFSARDEGIVIMRDLLKEGRIKVAEHCYKTVRSFLQYSYQKDEYVERSEKIKSPYSHLMDAWRYMAASAESFIPHKALNHDSEEKRKPKLSELEALQQVYGGDHPKNWVKDEQIVI